MIPISRRYILCEAASILLAIAGLTIGIRGGLQSTPLRWGDAFGSEHDVVNQLSLNGAYTLGRTLADNLARHDVGAPWMRNLAADDARRIAREMIVASGDDLLPGASTVVRRPGPQQRTLNLTPAAKRPNVVLVLMESFSAQFSAACGASRDCTPRFSQIAREGVLFDRAFSIGSHTHQGIFGTLLGFPNLPGYESMMQSQLANQPLASLPGVLGAQGYQTLFLYNGSFAWDNMEGFFRKHGVDRFIGGRDFAPGIRRDVVWGVDDLDLFRRANDEFEAASKNGPFMGIVLTLSNHAPWDLPSFPGEPSAQSGERNGPIAGIRYADYAVGEFIAQARNQSYFQNTLFIFVGDHGSREVSEKLTAAGLLTHHVPLLFYGPGVLDTAPHIDHTVASQLNIVPTVMGLLGLRHPHAAWGRDLFTAEGRANAFAIFKGSGGDNAIAIVRDDRVLVVDEAHKEKLYRYSLASSPFAEPVREPALQAQLRQQMNAIVQCALGDLRCMRAGPPLQPLTLRHAPAGNSLPIPR